MSKCMKKSAIYFDYLEIPPTVSIETESQAWGGPNGFGAMADKPFYLVVEDGDVNLYLNDEFHSKFTVVES